MCLNGNDIKLAYTVVVHVFRVLDKVIITVFFSSVIFVLFCFVFLFCFSFSLAISFIRMSRIRLAIAICGHAKLVSFSQKLKCMYVLIKLLRKP